MNKKRVFLGAVAVVPRADLKRHIERPFEGTSSDTALQSHLEAMFQLPAPPPPSQISARDYAIDVFVAKHQIGEAFEFSFSEYGFPLFWRPTIEVSSRVYSLHNSKAVSVQHVKKRLRWGEYFNRVFSFRGVFGFKSPFTHEDMTRLLDEALIETLEKSRARL